MNSRLLFIAILVSAICAGCAKNEASGKQAQAANDAKVRAEAARKEMQALPQAFRPRYNKRLEPETAAPAKAAPEKQQ